jgi:hypothetical protein
VGDGQGVLGRQPRAFGVQRRQEVDAACVAADSGQGRDPDKPLISNR